MQIILASAKIMRERCPIEGIVPHEPIFSAQARMIASEMRYLSTEELAERFSCSLAIAERNRERFAQFGTDEAEIMPAVMAYNGQAYRHLRATEMDHDELEYADRHMWISSCLYGLLRPLDGISCYRMEGGFPLNCTKGSKVAGFWKDYLTETLISSVKQDDGVLVYLDTEEFRELFDWKMVTTEISVIEPEFHVMSGGRMTTPSVWAKTCRGAMARFIIENRVEDPSRLKEFAYEGFIYAKGEQNPMYVRNFRK